MDLSTIFGLIICVTTVTLAITVGGPLVGFLDLTSFLVVVCGSAAAVVICYPIKTLKGIGGLGPPWRPRDPRKAPPGHPGHYRQCGRATGVAGTAC